MLEVRHLSVNYRGVEALDDISMTLEAGELVGLIGPNGAGKSTLIKALLGLVPAYSGQVLLHGVPLRRQRNRIAYVPQRSQIDWDYPITAWNVVMMARTAVHGWYRRPDAKSRQIVSAALDRVEMLPLQYRQIGELSGGQQQRIFLARAIAQQADVFLLDEPFAGVDKKTEGIILQLFQDLRSQGKTLLVCSHEWGQSLHHYDRLLLLNQRLVANGEPDTVMTMDNIQRAYGVSFQPSLSRQVESFFYC